jgi:hypothetical protein
MAARRVGEVVRQFPAGKNVSTEAEDIVVIRNQATTCEDAADGNDVVRGALNC